MGKLTCRVFIEAAASIITLGGGGPSACNIGGAETDTAHHDRLAVLIEDIVIDPVRVGQAFRRATKLVALARHAIARPHIAQARV